MPLPASPGHHASGVEIACDRPERYMSVGADCLNDLPQRQCMSIGVLPDRRPQGRTALPRPPQRFGTV